ncbi:dTDP-4-amino-4,6-dideoxygalactose transaminase [Desulfobaculum xiamenense]|uniref:dTDP-4-amino-4,6-dideoxygalactose transaminase n=1 Tax=Desulfobaculum xiamenense TaxID=995050 RepID=A0A846QKN3_9BACT|nr:DegT/DnrJ/EryC1/StrS family aminotransferase [Desulfobaculum xiamenense]NJB69506.1 dTDP-4-amino-4,6-dideoxygalactose transaminase [Desulfobaculum xiamenense]
MRKPKGNGDRIPLARPCVTAAVRERVLAVLDSGQLTEGPVTAELESQWAAFTGATHAVAATSCTTGLELVLRTLGVGPGDEVLVPDFTYPATALAVLNVGADVVLVDVDPRTMLVDYRAMEEAAGPNVRVAVPVSIFGNPLDYGQLAHLSNRGITIVEDAACALGATFGGRRVGSLADVSVFSMHPRKTVTTGEGGMITTSDGELAERLRSCKHFGMVADADSPTGMCFSCEGTNLKLSDVLAAIGVAQMERIDAILAERAALAAGYVALLADAPGVTLPEITPGGTHGWQSFCVFVERRDEIMARMRRHNIEAQIGTYALHMQPVFRDNPRCRLHGTMEGGRRVFSRCLALPLFVGMTAAQQRRVVDELLAAMGVTGRNDAATA